MNHTLTLAILLLAATGWGETTTNPVYAVSTVDELGRTNINLIIGTSPPPVAVTADLIMMGTLTGDYSSNIHLSDKEIRKLAASGEICRVFGHWYPNVWIDERKCKLCGKVETKTEVWK